MESFEELVVKVSLWYRIKCRVRNWYWNKLSLHNPKTGSAIGVGGVFVPEEKD